MSGVTNGDGDGDGDGDPFQRRHVLRDLGWAVRRSGGELHGWAPVVPEMHAPGTAHLRTSILATWADTLSGLLAADRVAPRVPVTLDLDLHLYRPAPADGVVHGIGRVVKSGRSVFVAGVDFADDHGEPIGFGACSFVPAPDTTLRMPERTSVDLVLAGDRRLTVPFAERAGCERRSPGTAALVSSDESLNASNTVNGGLLALVAEEAMLSLAPGSTLSSLSLRYLQPIRVGPVSAEAELHDALGRMFVRDAAADHRLCVLGTGRLFPAAPS